MAEIPYVQLSNVFNPDDFLSNNTDLTIATGDLRYIKINSFGLLSSLNVSGNCDVGSLSILGSSVDLSLITGVTNGVGQADKVLTLNSSLNVSNINSLSATSLTGTLLTSSQPNINEIGTLSDLTISNASNSQLSLTSSGASHYSGIKLFTNGNDWEFGSGGSTNTASNSFFIYDTTNTSYRMNINSSGNVGIGETSPFRKLTVNGDISLDDGNGIYFDRDITTGDINSSIYCSDISNLTIESSRGGGNVIINGNGGVGGANFIVQDLSTEIFRIVSDGKVGIGSTNPDKKLEINSSTGDCLRLTYNDSNGSALNYTDISLLSDGSLVLNSSGDRIFLENRTIIDNTATDALLIRKEGNTGDVFMVDTLSSNVEILSHNSSTTGLKLGGVLVTSSANEINILDGVTSTTAELNILDGVTSTTAELNILDGVTSTTAELNILDGVTSTTAELNILDGVTSTATELNYLDLTTGAGTGEASKALVLDSSKNITDINTINLADIRISGSSLNRFVSYVGDNYLQSGVDFTGGSSANLFIANMLQDKTTSSRLFSFMSSGKVGIQTNNPDKQLEINSSTGECLRLTYNDANGSAVDYCDFYTSLGGALQIAPSGGVIINEGSTIIDSTFTSAFLVRKDGNSGNIFSVDTTNSNVDILSHNSSTTGLKLGGVLVTSSANEINILDGLTSTTAELNILDGVTSTTAELNILDGVTSTTAELNILDGVTSTATELNYLDLTTGAGTGEASKALVLDGSRDITNINNLTASFATLSNSGSSQLSLLSSVNTHYAGIQLNTNGNDWQMGAGGSSHTASNSFFIYDNLSASYRMNINSSGNVGIGETSPYRKLTVGGDISLDDGNGIYFDRDITTGDLNSSIYCDSASNLTLSSQRGNGGVKVIGNNSITSDYLFAVYNTTTEYFKINYNGKVFIGDTPTGTQCQLHLKQNVNNNTSGIKFEGSGTSNCWNAFYSSATDLQFQYNGTDLGYLSASGSDTQMNFTGQHRSYTYNENLINDIDNYIGLIVCFTGEYKNMNDDKLTVNDALPIVDLSIKENDKKVFGCISKKEGEERIFKVGIFATKFLKNQNDTRLFINSVGEGMVYCCDINGEFEKGDLITTSNIKGYGMKQKTDFVKNYTFGKITQNCDFSICDRYINELGEIISEEEYNLDTKKNYRACLIGCVYYCG